MSTGQQTADTLKLDKEMKRRRLFGTVVATPAGTGRWRFWLVGVAQNALELGDTYEATLSAIQTRKR